MNRLSSRLAAHASIRQTEVLCRADDADAALDRFVGQWWRALGRLLKSLSTKNAYDVHRLVLAATRGWQREVAQEVYRRLHELALWQRRQVVQTLVRTLPQGFLASAVKSWPRGSVLLSEGRGERLTPTLEAGSVILGIPRDPNDGQFRFAELGPTSILPGSFKLDVFSRRLDFGLPFFHPLDPQVSTSTGEPVASTLGMDEVRKLLQDLVFPMDMAEVNRIVFGAPFGSPWPERLAQQTSLAEPATLANVIASGFAAGRTPQQVQQTLLPLVDNVRSTARRLARTEGIRVAHDIGMAQHEKLGDMVEGYQIHATLDQHTRPAHRARHGTIYYRHPRPGQLGFDQLPHPPLEADGSVALNCRCFLIPILAPPPRPVKAEAFADAAKELVPDPVIYAQWFDRATERKRRQAVGTRRYSAAQAVVGGKPSWEHFVTVTGDVLSVEQIHRETPRQRKHRLVAVRRVMAERAAAVKQVAAFGYVNHFS